MYSAAPAAGPGVIKEISGLRRVEAASFLPLFEMAAFSEASAMAAPPEQMQAHGRCQH